jgi:hypothetical protein
VEDATAPGAELARAPDDLTAQLRRSAVGPED